MKFAFYTLGCKVNQHDSAIMAALFQDAGYEVVDFNDLADVYVVNTCTVTHLSDRKSRQMIRHAARENPAATIVVCGCYAQANPDEIRKLDVDVLVGTADRRAFISHLEQAAEHKQKWEKIEDNRLGQDFEILPAGGLEGRTRAMLKVEDGCVNFCTYCIIPYARGPVRSLPLEQAVAQTRRLREEGYREIVFTGIEISSWGHDFKDGSSLIDLLEAVSAAAGDMRLRLGSLEPRTITEDFCRRAARLPNLCEQFHLSLQSGCDETLRRMNRRYDTARFAESVHLLRAYFDRPAITTDLITGFPGETEEEFAQTLDFIRACDFARMHIFPYSIRPGTKAAAMEQLPRAVKEERAARAAAVAEQMRQSYLAGCVGFTYPVLFEQPKDGRYAGHAPNYTDVEVDGENLHNEVRAVEITGVEGDILIGRIV